MNMLHQLGGWCEVPHVVGRYPPEVLYIQHLSSTLLRPVFLSPPLEEDLVVELPELLEELLGL